MLIREINRSILSGIFVAIGSFLVTFLLNIVIANLLSKPSFGDFSVAYTWVKFLIPIALLGGRKIIPKFLSQYKKHQRAHASGILIFYSSMALLIGLSISLCFFWFSYIDIHFITRAGIDQYHPIVLALFMIPLVALNQINGAILQTHHQFFWAQSSVKTFPFLLFMLFLGSIYFYQITYNVWYTFVTFIIAYLLIVFFQYYLIKKFSSISFIKQKATYLPKEWLALSLPIMGVSITFQCIRLVDITMIELIGKSEEIVAYIAAALSTVRLLWIAKDPCDTIMMPLLSEAMQKGHQAVEKIYRVHTFYSSILGLIITTVIILFGRPLLKLFGPGYTVAYFATVTLALAHYIKVISSSTVYLLGYYAVRGWLVWTEIICIILIILLNFLLIPLYGIEGAAFATLVGMSASAFTKMIILRLKLNIRLISFI